jgi:dolichol-phosphate mannosyltransferase
MLLSIVVPVYREEKNVQEFIPRIRAVLGAITEDYEIIFSLDPSPDRTEDAILEHRAKDPRIKLLKFSRRFGQPMAIIAGMQYASGDAVVVMDVDLQDPPELVAEMVAQWRAGFDVVMAQRRSRQGETLLKKLVARTGYAIIKRISEVPIPPNTGEFRLMSRRVVDEVVRLKETHGFLRGLVAVVGFKQATLQFDRPQRFAGSGNYNRLWGSIKVGVNGIVCFSSYALTLSTQLGFLLAGGSFFFGLLYLLAKIFNLLPFASGNPTIVVLVLFMGGIQLISVGILGEYVARIYEEVRGRPKFIVDAAVGFSGADANDRLDKPGC